MFVKFQVSEHIKNINVCTIKILVRLITRALQEMLTIAKLKPKLRVLEMAFQISNDIGILLYILY